MYVPSTVIKTTMVSQYRGKENFYIDKFILLQPNWTYGVGDFHYPLFFDLFIKVCRFSKVYISDMIFQKLSSHDM